MVKGDLGSMISKRIRFEVNKCSNATKPEQDCASPEEIEEYVKDLQIDTWNMFEKIDYTDYIDRPAYRVQDIIGSSLVTPGRVDKLILYLRQHYVETQDEWMQLGQYTFKGYFYQIGKTVNRPTVKEVSPNSVYIVESVLLSEQIKHTRQIYGWLDLLGDLGGVTEVIMICFGFFLYPISEHSFTLKAIRKLFLVRTREENLFLRDEKAEKKEEDYRKSVKT